MPTLRRALLIVLALCAAALEPAAAGPPAVPTARAPFPLQAQIGEIRAEGLGTLNKEPEAGSTVRLSAQVILPPEYHLMYCLWLGTLPKPGASTAPDCRWQYVPLLGPGPQVATYGSKQVVLYVVYMDSGGQVLVMTKTHAFKVFFRKLGYDLGPALAPNWFHYWRLNRAVPGLDAPDVSYDPTLSAYGEWRPPPDDTIHIGWQAAMYFATLKVAAGPGCPGATFAEERGITTAAVTVAHERRHQEIWRRWSPGGMWVGQADSDDPTPAVKSDLPADSLPDAYELVRGTDPLSIDSCNLAAVLHPTYAAYGDEEWDCMVHSESYRGVASRDWANPGKQTTSPYSAAAGGAVGGPRGGPASAAGPASFAGRRTVPGMARLAGGCAAAAEDADGDGLYNVLHLSVTAYITVPAAYNVVAWLQDAAGTAIAWASAPLTLSAGLQTVTLPFDGRTIARSGLDGPYRAAAVELRSAEDDYLADAATAACTTTAYQAGDFDPPAVAIAGGTADRGEDTDWDGLYNLLLIDLALDVHEPGLYTVTGELWGPAGLDVAAVSRTLAPGAVTMTLALDGPAIYYGRSDGPYRLRSLRVAAPGGEWVDWAATAYTTTAYRYDQFDHGLTAIDPGSYTDWGVDGDADGIYEALRVQFAAEADRRITGTVVAQLLDAGGAAIAAVSQTLDLVTGTQAVTLTFPGPAIYAHQVHGPYTVASVALIDRWGWLLDWQQVAHTTQPYRYSDFGPAWNVHLPLVQRAAGSAP